MEKLYKLNLDFEPTLKYVKDNLDHVNTLSSELVNLLNFEEGYFFTLLPNNANTQAIYHFESGWILPPNPIMEYFVDGHKAAYSIKNSIETELTSLIFELINSKTNFSCILDDFEGYPKDRYEIHYNDNYSLFYGDEIYLHLHKDNLSKALILELLRASNKIWHSLCVFTTAKLSKCSKTIKIEEIKEICIKTKLIMVCAYDGEGYVFWEKNSANIHEFFVEK